MWLTGFDSPSMHTMYVDKPMRGAGLMQAIARVNRTFRDKPGGLVVDYIGIAESLKAALADYTDRDRDRQEVGAPVEEALALLEEKHEVLCELLYGCPWREALDSGSDRARIEAIMAALEHLLGGVRAGPAGPVPAARPHRQSGLHPRRLVARGAALPRRPGVLPGGGAGAAQDPDKRPRRWRR